MKLMCRIYVVKEHDEVSYMGSRDKIRDRMIIEEKCYSETDDELEIGHAVHKEVGRQMTIDSLYKVREALAKGDGYFIDNYVVGKSGHMASLSQVTYNDGQELDKAVEYIYLEKEWTIEK